MVIVKTGNKKKAYRSIKLAAQASGIKYITLYMRLRAGNKAATAMKKPVRVYNRKGCIEELPLLGQNPVKILARG